MTPKMLQETSPTISLVIESWNLGRDPARVESGVAALLSRLGTQVEGVQVVVTHEEPGGGTLARIAGATWVEVPRGSTYYAHKNLGFAATRGDIVAFIDGDCAPSAEWLHRLVEPIARGPARVVAGRTSYEGPHALETALDFPLFPSRQTQTQGEAGCVRNFFANNVAFAREAFSGYPDIPGMYHGQCQVLALSLAASGIAIHFAPEAAIEHDYAEDRREWRRIHLLRGADASSLAPHVVGAYVPALTRVAELAAPLPALLGIGARGAVAAVRLLRARKGRLAGLSTIAAVSALESMGAVVERTVHRRLAPRA